MTGFIVSPCAAQGYVTRTRRTLDRALAALPVTQHDRLWQLYLEFVTQPDVPKATAFRVYRRYLKCAARPLFPGCLWFRRCCASKGGV